VVILFPPIFFARKALTSGPQACIFGGIEKEKSEESVRARILF
jgi:hypothetical protein